VFYTLLMFACIRLQHSDMNAGAKLAALNKFRGANTPIGRPPITRVLVTCDVQVKPPEVQQVPLVINYGTQPTPTTTQFLTVHCIDLPKAVEEYAHRSANHKTSCGI
jgi:hypothetical protein